MTNQIKIQKFLSFQKITLFFSTQKLLPTPIPYTHILVPSFTDISFVCSYTSLKWNQTLCTLLLSSIHLSYDDGFIYVIASSCVCSSLNKYTIMCLPILLFLSIWVIFKSNIKKNKAQDI